MDVSAMSIIEKLIPLTSKYPEIIKIIDAVEKQDYGTLLTRLQEFIQKYPELASIIG